MCCIKCWMFFEVIRDWPSKGWIMVANCLPPLMWWTPYWRQWDWGECLHNYHGDPLVCCKYHPGLVFFKFFDWSSLSFPGQVLWNHSEIWAPAKRHSYTGVRGGRLVEDPFAAGWWMLLMWWMVGAVVLPPALCCVLVFWGCLPKNTCPPKVPKLL